jgi:hypothetical protein
VHFVTPSNKKMTSYLPPTRSDILYNPANFPQEVVSEDHLGTFLIKSGDTATGVIAFNLGLRSSAPISNEDGTALLPSYTFTNDSSHGFYSAAASTIGMAGALQTESDSSISNAEGEGLIIDGTGDSVSLQRGGVDVFSADSVASEILHSGTPVITASNALVSLSSPASIPDGLVNLPGLHFSGDATTGIYLDIADRLSIVHDGQSCATFDPSFSVIDGRLGVATSTAAQPGLYFNNDQDTGVDALSANTLNLVAGGSAVCGCTSSGLEVLVGGLLLPTAGGTQTALDYYEEWNDAAIPVYQDSTTTDFLTASSTASVKVTRIGRIITVTWDDISGTTAGTARAEFTVPTRFSPSSAFTVHTYQGESSGSALISSVSAVSGGDIRFSYGTFPGDYPTGVATSIEAGSITYCCP